MSMERRLWSALEPELYFCKEINQVKYVPVLTISVTLLLGVYALVPSLMQTPSPALTVALSSPTVTSTPIPRTPTPSAIVENLEPAGRIRPLALSSGRRAIGRTLPALKQIVVQFNIK